MFILSNVKNFIFKWINRYDINIQCQNFSHDDFKKNTEFLQRFIFCRMRDNSKI